MRNKMVKQVTKKHFDESAKHGFKVSNWKEIKYRAFVINASAV
ncbi:hypothetical protein [Acetobacterium bakii]|nr:hypothetical protein [Acetobacterium bakii]